MLKGDDTLVAAPGGRVAVSPGGAPALATAGTGDVLAGVTGAMLAKGLAAGHGRLRGVHVHVLAGRLAAAPHGPDGVIASDVIAALPGRARALRRGTLAPPMPLTVADIMETDVPTVLPEDTVEAVLRTLREHELPGVPVVNSGGRCVGIITEADLVLAGEDADLHLPHYFELFGGLVFLEPLQPLRGAPAQGDRRARRGT